VFGASDSRLEGGRTACPFVEVVSGEGDRSVSRRGMSWMPREKRGVRREREDEGRVRIGARESGSDDRIERS
jgi:hypothetical protein